MKRGRFAEGVGLSATGVVDEKARERRLQNRPVFDLGAGQPDFRTPAAIAEGGIEAIRAGKTRYTSPQGSLELREAIAEKLERENDLSYSPEAEILVSGGAKHSIHNLLAAVLSPGEEVLLPTPTWVSYPEMIRLLGGKARFVETKLEERFRMSPEALRRAIGPRVVGLLLNTPCNPTGAVYDAEELEALAAVIDEAGLWVITDEIYERIVYDGRTPVSLPRVAPRLRDSVAIVNGVSKAFAMTGWRIGYAAGPADWIATAASIQSHQTGNPCSISQEAARIALLACGDEPDRMRAIFERRRDQVLMLLDGIEGLELFRPEGTFYLLPRIAAFLGARESGPPLSSDGELAGWLLEETGVATVPGTAFAAPGHLRISFAASEETLREGLGRLREALVRRGARGNGIDVEPEEG